MTTESVPRQSDEELLDIWLAHNDSIKKMQALVGHIEMVLRQRLTERGATEIAHPTLSVRLEARHGGYDISKLWGLKELVAPEVWAEAFTPAYNKITPVPDSLDARKAAGWGKRFGKEVAQAIEEAELPRVVRLVIRLKEKGG